MTRKNHPSRREAIGRNWGRNIVIPQRNKGKGRRKSTARTRKKSAHREEPENITIAENEKRRRGRDRDENEDTQLVPNSPRQDEAIGNIPRNT